MTIFNKKPSEPEPPAPTPPEPPAEPSFVTKDELEASVGKITESLNTLNLKFENFSVPQAPAAPALPTPPTEDPTKKELEEIDRKLAQVSPDKIDKAAYEGKGVGSMLAEREKLLARKSQIETQRLIDSRITPLEQTGLDAIDKLTGQVTAAQMPMLKHDAVKKSYEEKLQLLDPSVRVNPEVRMTVYNAAVGANMGVIIESELEEKLRANANDDTQPPPPGSTSSRTTDTNTEGEIPPPEKVLTPANIAAIRRKGGTVDSYYQSLGYKGWEDHYEQNKSYYEGESANE